MLSFEQQVNFSLPLNFSRISNFAKPWWICSVARPPAVGQVRTSRRRATGPAATPTEWWWWVWGPKTSCPRQTIVMLLLRDVVLQTLQTIQMCECIFIFTLCFNFCISITIMQFCKCQNMLIFHHTFSDVPWFLHNARILGHLIWYWIHNVVAMTKIFTKANSNNTSIFNSFNFWN